MCEDAAKIGYSISKVDVSNMSSFNVNFITPNFNASTERIIIAVVNNNWYDDNDKVNIAHDYHFYLRNGNGTCSAH